MGSEGTHEREQRKSRKGMIIVLCVVAVLVVGGAVLASMNFDAVQGFLRQVMGGDETSAQGGANFDEGAIDAAIAEKDLGLKTAQIAYLDDVIIRSPIAPRDLTGVLFHQASYPDAYRLWTELPYADLDLAYETRVVRVNNAQADVRGWVDADALHISRRGAETEMDGSIDVGGMPGTPVYAPVTGTVVLVQEYMLYDEMPDYRIHIQPDGRPDLDCAILHTDHPIVRAGDHVTAGVTQLSVVRDMASYIDEIQLGDFTEDGGNHAHVQISDANDAGYRRRCLMGALLTGQETAEQVALQQRLEAEAQAAEQAAEEQPEEN